MTDAAVPVADGLDRAKLRYADIDGVRTRYYEDGTGEPDAQACGKEQVTDDFVERMYQVALLPQRQASQQCRDRVAPNVWMPSLNRKRQEALRLIDEKTMPTRTLLIWGFDDRSAPLPQGLELFTRICRKTPHAEMHILRGAGHYSYRDQYQAFNRTLTSFCLG